MNTVFISEQHLQPWIVYIQCIWQIFLFKRYCYFKGTLAVIRLSGIVIISGGYLQWSSIFKGTVFLWNKHLQSSLLIDHSSCSHLFDERLFFYCKRALALSSSFKFTVFFLNRRRLVARRYHIVINYDTYLVSGSTWSDPLCQEHCVYFATRIATIHYNKQSVVDSRKFEGYCVYLKKAIVALLFWRGLFFCLVFACRNLILSCWMC